MASSKKSSFGIERITAWVGSLSSLVVHTALFAAAFGIALWGIAPWETVLLTVTTIVSLEAIYLAIFIQISVNRAAETIEDVEEDIAGLEENIGEISEDIENIEKDVAEIEEDLGEVSEDIEDIQEDITELSAEDTKDAPRKQTQAQTLAHISATLQQLIEEVEKLKKQ